MPTYYLDIETTGLDPRKDKIITIQFAELDRNSAEQIGVLKILKEWELGEKKLLEEFVLKSSLDDPYDFKFVPLGYNLGFDHKFFLERCKVNGLEPINILNKPFIDLKPLGIIMNKGEFKGSGLDKLTGKLHDGSIVPTLYAEKKYQEIEDYIRTEAREFLKFCEWVYKELPSVLEKFKLETNSE